VVRVGNAGGVLALGFGESLYEVVESLLQGGAGHRKRLSLATSRASLGQSWLQAEEEDGGHGCEYGSGLQCKDIQCLFWSSWQPLDREEQ
jgi:hypothetical protein